MFPFQKEIAKMSKTEKFCFGVETRINLIWVQLFFKAAKRREQEREQKGTGK